MNFRENEDAVSPVIGVILMVAITVILAAVIAAFVFGMAGNVDSTKNVAVTAKQVGANIAITYQGGADAASVDYINWSVDGTAMDPLPSDPTVGMTATNGTKPVASGQNHVVVTATFTDGSTQVVLDTYV